jgi:hypothetical protein
MNVLAFPDGRFIGVDSVHLWVYIISCNTEAAMAVAETILQQLGGKRFIVMTGARSFVGSDHALMFALPSCKNGINKVRITLDPSDTYTVEFFRIRGMKSELIKSLSDVYFDQLQEVFTDETGLFTTL